jgi:hypothetical protein
MVFLGELILRGGGTLWSDDCTGSDLDGQSQTPGEGTLTKGLFSPTFICQYILLHSV